MVYYRKEIRGHIYRLPMDWESKSQSFHWPNKFISGGMAKDNREFMARRRELLEERRDENILFWVQTDGRTSDCFDVPLEPFQL
jgi:hypothetical protein